MKRVVLVDDDRDDAELFQEALEEVDNNLLFQHFENAQAALAEWVEARTVLPDVIFLDLNLPQVSGWEILKQLRQAHHMASIPVIMYTTSSQKKEEEIAHDLGANFFITKPSDYKELKSLLTELLVKVLE
jgi:CheY-like chemotaxis protein